MKKQFDRKTVVQVIANKIISQVQYVSGEFTLALDGQMLSSSSGFGCSKDLVGDKIVGVENDFNPTSDFRLAFGVETYVNISQTYIYCHEFASRHGHSPFAVGYNFLQFSYNTVTLFCQFLHQVMITMPVMLAGSMTTGANVSNWWYHDAPLLCLKMHE